MKSMAWRSSCRRRRQTQRRRARQPDKDHRGQEEAGQRFAEDAQNDLQGEMQEIYNTVASKVYDVLSTYAQQQATRWCWMQRKPATVPVVLFAGQNIDITKAVIEPTT